MGMSVDLEALYLEHEPRVRWIMHARGVDAGSVDDLVHESFMTMHRRWAQRDRTVPLAIWVSGVARNVAFSFRRAEARRKRRLRAMPEPPAPASPDETVAEREAWQELEAFTRELSPKLREVFVLADVSGMPVNEIAQTSGLPVATLHSRLRLARRRFAAHFAGRASPQQRGAMLQRAAEQQTPSPAARRRSLAALMAAVEIPGAGLVPVAAASSKATAWVVAVVIAGVGGLVAVDQSIERHEPRPPRSEPAQTPAPQTARTDAPPGTPAVAAPLPAAEPAPTVSAPTAKTAKTAKTAETAKNTRARPNEPPSDKRADAFAAHVAALERARALSKSGAPSLALEALAEVETRSPALVRDHHRLVRDAACALGHLDRAEQAARALAKLGLAANPDDPCRKNTTKQ